MKANPKPHGKKPLSCLPFDAYRAIINHHGGETVGVISLPEDDRHWIKRQGRIGWQDDYEYKVLNSAEFDTFKAIGIPVFDVTYRPFTKWLARQRSKTWLPWLPISAWVAFMINMACGELLTGYETGVFDMILLWLVAAAATAFMMMCAWAEEN